MNDSNDQERNRNVGRSKAVRLYVRDSLPFFLTALVLGIAVFALFNGRAGPQTTGPVASQVAVEEIADPRENPNALPKGFRQLLDRDSIAPVYDPTFEPAAESSWADNVLVIGLAINGDARAYPVGYLNRREMVIDTVGGLPILVSW